MFGLTVFVVAFLAGGVAGSTMNDEPNYTFRDGCQAQTVKAAGGNYGYTSYAHCSTLPRVYNGKTF
jgi:hypothetical protein